MLKADVTKDAQELEQPPQPPTEPQEEMVESDESLDTDGWSPDEVWRERIKR